MSNTLAEIRARLQQAETNNNNQNFDNSTFPFWNAPNGSTSEVRFVPDGNLENPYFWVTKYSIKLPFNGVKNGDAKPVYVTVPCIDRLPDKEGNSRTPFLGEEPTDFAQGCPILNEVRGWYKEKDQASTELANKYWKKPTFIMQGFVRVNSVPDDKSPENPIRKFSFNKQLFNLIKAGLLDKDMDNLPTDFSNGSDFRMAKTAKGQYADYGTSSYSRKESSLTPDELAAIEKYKLANLSDYLGKKPTQQDLDIIKEMFEASVNGEAYDTARWGQFYRPANFKSDETSTTASVTSTDVATQEAPQVSTVSSQETTAVATPEVSNGKTKANDILNMIKAKRAAQQS
jgi:hypothetical protein